ncbi:MAG: carboxypeptidase-like regulatory domain-containing protein [Bacteroidales bacterium]|nr:carboxypeptidase-like regulatory domain-containing protein [Bacteroidales bacterium]
MRKTLCLIASAILCSCLASFAQAQDSKLEFSAEGKVVDDETGRPLEGVDVGTKERGFYTVTNADGAFSIRSDSPISQVEFSLPGYVPKEVSISGSAPFTVRLVSVSNLLKESLIVDGDAREIVQKAMDKIDENYPAETETFDCFYRETVRKKQKYINISEAVTILKKENYAKRSITKDAVSVRVGRSLVSPNPRDTLSVKVLGGPSQAVKLDPVKNEAVFLSKDDLKLYDFKMATPEMIGGKWHLVIDMAPNTEECPYALYYGRLYIDQETLAFSRMELSLDMSDRTKAIQMMLVHKPLGLRFFPKSMLLTVSYVPDPADGLMRLRYLRTSFDFNCDWRKRGVATSFIAVNEMVVTHRRIEDTPFSKSEAFPASESLSDHLQEFKDPDFWKDYNIIEPSESLEHAINRLRRSKQ